MTAVLDASAAVRATMDEESPFQTAIDGAGVVIAPELIVAEVCNAFRKYVRARMLTGSQSEVRIARALTLVDELHPMRDLVPDVLALAAHSDSSVYDLFYVALARRMGAILLTADLALSRNAHKLGVAIAE